MQIKKFEIVGISVRTTNENGQSSKDIPKLWERFFAEKISEKIPNKKENKIYSLYTDYESDFTKPYTVVLGCAVTDLKNIPQGMVSKTVQGGNFVQFKVKDRSGVFPEWMKIWKSNLNRSYTADFEVYDHKDPEVNIYIAVKEEVSR